MADLSDVTDAIAGVLAAALYPEGAGGGRMSVAGLPVTILPAWPEASTLTKALAAKQAMVSVFPPPNLERATTRALSQWLPAGTKTRTVTALADPAAGTVTLGGTVSGGLIVGLIVDEATFAYAIQPTDTLPGIASALAALVAASGRAATSSGPVLTIPGTHRLVARIGIVDRLAKEVERSDRVFMVTVWAPSPAARKAVARVVRNRLATLNFFIALADGSAGWIRYDRTNEDDQAQREGLYRRDLSYWVEFGEYDVEVAYEVTLPQSAVQPARPDGATAGPPFTTTS